MESWNSSYYKALHNGQIYSPKKREGITAVGLEGDLISIVDTDERVLGWAEERRAKSLDLKGRPLVPGFIDAHVHLLSTGIEASSLRIHGLTSITSILEIIRGEVLRAPAGRPISVYSYNELQLEARRPPTMEELDLVAPHHPVFLSRSDLHSCVLNTKALERLRLNRKARGPLSGQESYRARGEFLKLYSQEEKERAMREAAFRAIRAGVTTLHAMEGGHWQGDDAIDIALAIKEEIPVSMALYPMTHDIDFIRERGLNYLGGDLFLDGSFGSKTAALSMEYSDSPGKRGSLYYKRGDLLSMVKWGIALGLKMGFHVIGDRAIEQALDVIEEVSSMTSIPEASFRLEHFSLPHPHFIKKAKKLGIGIGIQATSKEGREMMVDRLGKERASLLYPHKEMYDEGLLLAVGSDSNVDAMNPLHSIARLMKDSFSFEEALSLCTWNGAQIVGEGNRKGRIDQGMAADLALLSKDPSHLALHLEGAEVLWTMVKGKIEYQGLNL